MCVALAPSFHFNRLQAQAKPPAPPAPSLHSMIATTAPHSTPSPCPHLQYSRMQHRLCHVPPHQKQACCRLHMQPLSVAGLRFLSSPTMGGGQSKEERRRHAEECRRNAAAALDAACRYVPHPSLKTLRPLPLPLIGTCSREGKKLQRRLDVRVETALFTARPALMWAFQISKEQLQATFTQRPSLLHPTAAQVRAFGLQFGAKQRQSLVTSSRLPSPSLLLMVTLSGRLMRSHF